MDQIPWFSIERVPWFPLVFGAIGILFMLSGVYEWSWVWKLERGKPLLYWLGWRNTRLLYLLMGIGNLAVALSLSLQFLLSSNSIFVFAVGFFLSGALAALLFNSRNNQSIVEFILNRKKE